MAASVFTRLEECFSDLPELRRYLELPDGNASVPVWTIRFCLSYSLEFDAMTLHGPVILV